MTGGTDQSPPHFHDPDTFADVLFANQDYANHFDLGDIPALAARRLAVLTCMDSRIEPLAMLGPKGSARPPPLAGSTRAGQADPVHPSRLIR